MSIHIACIIQQVHKEHVMHRFIFSITMAQKVNKLLEANKTKVGERWQHKTYQADLGIVTYIFHINLHVISNS